MRTRVAAVIVVVAVSLAIIVVVAVRMLAYDREALLDRFATSWSHQLEEAIAEIEGDLESVATDLRLAARLGATSNDSNDLPRELAALLEVSRLYVLIEVRYHGDKAPVRVDRKGGATADGPELEELITTSVASARETPDLIIASTPLAVGNRSLRIFAHADREADLTAVTVVDTGRVFDRLRIVTADPGMHLVVIGSHGLPAPFSDPTAVRLFKQVESGAPGPATTAALYDDLTSRKSGRMRIPGPDARTIGLGNDEVIAIYQPIAVEGGEPWAAALLVSTTSIARHDRVIVRRLIVIVALIIGIVVISASYLIFNQRRAVRLEEQMRSVELERQLLRSEQLATVGVLAAGIAHEIGTPLSVARGRAEYALTKLGNDHPQANSQNIIIDQIDLVSRGIRRLLDFARVGPEGGNRPVDVGAAIDAVVELLALEADARGITFDVEVEDALPRVLAGVDQLGQVLVNLIMNACDACRRGSVVEIVARVDGSAADRVLLRVSDDGRGMTEEERDKLFEPFYTTKAKGKGTGLGMTIVEHIVRDHGGTIEVESELGVGTTVSISWPAADREARTRRRAHV